ncbi:DUF418 domain-containing protein [Segetibacter sp. 3557_3]|uniref:DUF418 domain-containing protein n=1 Tax=Segetibacter sp. 3557_3 TaxID=2547429 RepID=UPI001058C783|nr:DUF418 domain-containing protein [Segetibacter sp. 3557_3]TDH27518.1 DUF418 domain-containing protein [Segetibacter sp. 3557_3]
MHNSTAQPLQLNQRTEIVDMLRGWALLGVVLMNYADYYYMGLGTNSAKSDVLENVLQTIGNILFAAKSWTMLSFLFGYGFAVLMANVADKGLNHVKFFSRRMFWLFVLAIINSAFFWGDILKDYAVMGMILLAFHRCSAKTAFIIGMSLFLLTPAVAAYVSSLGIRGGMGLMEPYFPLYKSSNVLNVLWFGLVGTYLFEILSPNYLITVHVVMLGCFFLGLATQKINFFNRLAENRKYLKRIFWGSLAFIGLLIGIFALTSKMKWGWMKYYQPFYFIILSSMIFLVATLSWLHVSGKLKGFFRAMQTIGKMTLTNYIVQNILGMFLFSGFGFNLSLVNRVHFGYYLLFAFIIYVVQIFFSKWWLSRYYYGPIEWVWRQLSYAKRLPIKRESAAYENVGDSMGAVKPAS